MQRAAYPGGPMEGNRKIELHPAYLFDCDECGEENFCRVVVVEHGVSIPEEVECWNCGAEFVTENDAPE